MSTPEGFTGGAGGVTTAQTDDGQGGHEAAARPTRSAPPKCEFDLPWRVVENGPDRRSKVEIRGATREGAPSPLIATVHDTFGRTEARANAEMIVRAVNEREGLLADHEKWTAVAEAALRVATDPAPLAGTDTERLLLRVVEHAIGYDLFFDDHEELMRLRSALVSRS